PTPTRASRTAASTSPRPCTSGPCRAWAPGSRRSRRRTRLHRPRNLQGMSSSTILSRADLDFLLHDCLRVSDLCQRERYADHSRETIDAVVDLPAQLAEKYFAPHNRKADLTEPRLVGEEVELIPEIGEALRRFADADLTGAALDAEVGG